ncbi:DUF2165 domain-containing protein [Vibrio sp. EA2]|uniref:DUF2165 family protein n=1 Tax=Vibrio sp. EA2 TaxID=3079860 RepID=UPI00294A1809|nr:DUF2165 domain-containing protein [Vibrio sp. EA2]MDV6252782.1 DUF2165 domain-containing protein [Vibrio sp. EA2]
MQQLRIIKTVLVSAVALFALLVAFNNITDYGSNFAFVQHVLTMDTTFEGNQLMHRAIHTPAIHHISYAIIIFCEALAGVLCAYGAWKLWKARKAEQREFNKSKALANYGLTLGIVLWFTGFMTVGAEWFLMWQSSTWNGQAAAFKFIVILFLVLFFLNQKEHEEAY